MMRSQMPICHYKKHRHASVGRGPASWVGTRNKKLDPRLCGDDGFGGWDDDLGRGRALRGRFAAPQGEGILG